MKMQLYDWFSKAEQTCEAFRRSTEARWMEKAPALKKNGMKAGRALWILLCIFLIGGLSFVILYPLLFMLSMAFRTPTDIGDPSVIWIPKTFTLTNVSEAMMFMDYWRSFANSVQLCLVSSALQILSCALTGYGLARFRFFGKSLVFSLVILTIVIPPAVTYAPTYLMYNDFRLLDTPFVMYLPALLGVGVKSGLFIYIFRQFFINLPKELEDAAYIDGCGHMQTFLKIILPNAGAALLTVFLFSVVFYWNDYYVSSMYFTNTRTVSTALANLNASMSMFEGYEGLRVDPYLKATRMQAGCLLAIAPLLLLYMVMQHYFVTGMERSGIVG